MSHNNHPDAGQDLFIDSFKENKQLPKLETIVTLTQVRISPIIIIE